jgi:adenine-specific DNA-methyltransferase
MPPRDPVARTSEDPTPSRLAQLRALFPDAFADGTLDWDKLKAAVGDAGPTGAERFQFTWAGRSDAVACLQTPTRATLLPCEAESVDFAATKNLFVEGDNLEVLKLLYKPYHGRVKLIYIDPPYNTGQDFIYPDDFTDTLANYLALTRQADDAGNLLRSNPDTSGRYHSDWLSMMYPRLFLARQLLRDDGVIFVSIDDHEVHHLRMLMNEVFGEENFVATIAWQKKDSPSNDAKGFSTTHEYLMAFQRSEAFRRNLLPRTEEQLGNYKNPDNDPRGPWTRTTLYRKEVRKERIFTLVNPKGRTISPPPGTSWRVDQAGFEEYTKDDRIWWGSTGDGDLPFLKRFLTEVAEGTVPTSWWEYEFAGSNRNATVELREIFQREIPFDTPKPVLLLRRLLQVATNPDSSDLVLDFFAGSGTTAQAVLELNRADGGNRRFILVQLPEPTGNKKFPTIAEIGKERIRRVIANLKKETGNILRGGGERRSDAGGPGVQGVQAGGVALRELVRGRGADAGGVPEAVAVRHRKPAAGRVDAGGPAVGGRDQGGVRPQQRPDADRRPVRAGVGGDRPGEGPALPGMLRGEAAGGHHEAARADDERPVRGAGRGPRRHAGVQPRAAVQAEDDMNRLRTWRPKMP